MSLVKTFNNKHLIMFGIKVCQAIPRGMAPSIIELFASVVARFKHTDLIQAVRSNQRIINRADRLTQADLDQRTKAVIRHALICYFDFFHNLDNLDNMAALFPTADDLIEELAEITHGNGALIISPHLSNFNLVFHVITNKGFTSKVLTLSNIYSGYDLLNHLRNSIGAETIPADEGNHFPELVNYLKSGGIVATGVDRPVQGRKPKHRLNFFQHPSDLPAGYLTLALAANVPVIILSAFMNMDGTYGYTLIGPIHLEQGHSRLETITKNAEEILRNIETLIENAPEQWLMYYPVWPGSMDQGL